MTFIGLFIYLIVIPISWIRWTSRRLVDVDESKHFKFRVVHFIILLIVMNGGFIAGVYLKEFLS